MTDHSIRTPGDADIDITCRLVDCPLCGQPIDRADTNTEVRHANPNTAIPPAAYARVTPGDHLA